MPQHSRYYYIMKQSKAFCWCTTQTSALNLSFYVHFQSHITILHFGKMFSLGHSLQSCQWKMYKIALEEEPTFINLTVYKV